MMVRYLTLEYWCDDGWYVGRLKEVPGVFSRGETLGELEENIEEAYRLMMEAEDLGARPGVQTKEIGLEVRGAGSLSASLPKPVVICSGMARGTTST
jgi:predicted RNase H-like HicB family nuclease